VALALCEKTLTMGLLQKPPIVFIKSTGI
jgi:hypothetical protein